MPSIERILVPVDFSDACLKMMPYVRQFAEKYRSEVILLHVQNPVYTIPETGVSGLIEVPLPDWTIQRSAETLERFAAAELAGVAVRRLAYEGEPERQIVETADTEDVQLIMMSTRGRGVLRTFLLGSITSKVLHDTRRPVLTGVHAAEHSARAISTIAYAGQAEDVRAWAADLASDFQARLVQVEAGAEHRGADLLVIGRASRTDAYAMIRQSPCPVLSVG